MHTNLHYYLILQKTKKPKSKMNANNDEAAVIAAYNYTDNKPPVEFIENNRGRNDVLC